MQREPTYYCLLFSYRSSSPQQTGGAENKHVILGNLNPNVGVESGITRNVINDVWVPIMHEIPQ